MQAIDLRHTPPFRIINQNIGDILFKRQYNCFCFAMIYIVQQQLYGQLVLRSDHKSLCKGANTRCVWFIIFSCLRKHSRRHEDVLK